MVLNVWRYWIVQQPGTKNSWLHIIIYFSVLISIPSFRQWHHNINIANYSSSKAGKVLFSVTEKYNLLSCIIDRDISNFAIRCSILYRESLIHYVQVFKFTGQSRQRRFFYSFKKEVFKMTMNSFLNSDSKS